MQININTGRAALIVENPALDNGALELIDISVSQAKEWAEVAMSNPKNTVWVKFRDAGGMWGPQLDAEYAL